jgi:hypothetical protein
MVSSPAAAGKRRFSDQAFAGMVRDDGTVGTTKRRQTMDGALNRQQPSVLTASTAASSNSNANANSAPIPAPTPTPLKQKVSLGSAAASSYYFSGLPKTPLSKAKDFQHSSKKLKRDEDLIGMHTETSPTPTSSSQAHAHTAASTGSPNDTAAGIHGPEREETRPDMSILDESANDTSSSTESSDLMNKSVLSDTTELTASNFVLAATSRYKFMQHHPAKLQSEKENAVPSDQAPSPHSSEPVQPLPAASTTSVEEGPQRTSPSSLRKLTLSLMQSRLQKGEQANVQPFSAENQDETSSSKEFLDSEATDNVNTSAISKATSEKNVSYESDGSQLDVSKSSLDDLFDGLLEDDKGASPDSSSSLLVSPNARASESRVSTTGTSYQSHSGEKSFASLPSPGMSPIATEVTKDSSFRLTPSKVEPRLTPTKLKASPRRILNPKTTDSPARNTRSAAKTVASPEAVDKSSPIQEPIAFKIDSPPLQTTSTSKMSRQAIGLENQRVFDSNRASAPWPQLAPKSILNSAKKRSRISDVMARKTVAFGSPEAAEYHIGSPSVSLTPMHPMQAKAMYSIPSAGNRNFNTTVSSEESTASSMDEGSLIDTTMGTMGQDPSSGFQAPNHGQTNSFDSHEKACCDLSMEDKTVELESSLSGLMNISMPIATASADTNGYDITTSPMPVEPDLDQDHLPVVNMQQSFDAEVEKEDTETVPLETSISGLLQASNGDSEAQDLNGTTSTHDSNGEETIQLETSISGLLQASNGNSEDEIVDGPPSTQDSNEATDVKISEDEQITQQSPATINSELQQVIPFPTETMTSMMANASPSWHDDEDNTVELEADMSAIFAMASQGDEDPGSFPALKLADRFPKVGTLVPRTNRMSFGQPAITQIGIREEGQTPKALDFGLSDSPASTSVRQGKLRGRFSLAKSSRLSMASEGSAFAFSPTAGEASFSQEKIEMNPEEMEQEEEVQAMTSEEISEIVDFSGSYSQKRAGFHSAVQSLSNAEQDFNFQITDSLRSFSMAVCGEVEEKVALSSSGKACFNDLLQSVGDEMTGLQSWVRHADGTAEVKLIAASVRGVVEQEWCDWERTVLDSLIVALQNIPDEIDPEIRKLDHCMTLLDDLNESLSMAAGQAARRAKRLRFARHAVSKSSRIESDKEKIRR